MPYKREGNKIYHKVTGKWRVKQACKSIDSAKAAMRILKKLESKE